MPEPYDAHGDSPPDAADERLLKKWRNLLAALCLHFAYYNFCPIHLPLRVTPAMEAGIADQVWSLADLIANRI
jgi:hypothetical protein